MAGLGGRGACKGPSLDKEPVALTKGAEAGARPGLGDFWAFFGEATFLHCPAVPTGFVGMSLCP